MELTVPQVFESGARVAWDSSAVGPLVLSRVIDGIWHGWMLDADKETPICSASCIPADLRVVAPAPRDGQRWVGRDFVAFARGVGVGEISVHVSGGGGCVGEAVSVAIWLMEHGYTYAGQGDTAPATLRAPEAAPDPTPQPMPWGLAAARRRISEVLATATPRHRVAFTAALTWLAETAVPQAELIPSTVSALAALEAALPERGAIARWQEERAAWAAREHLEAAGVPDRQVFSALVACQVYLERRQRTSVAT